MRLVVATCSVDYTGRLTAHLPLAKRLIMVKGDGSVLIHSDSGSYKPLNWMSGPCSLVEEQGYWTVSALKGSDVLRITFDSIESDVSYELGVDPGLQKDGVEKHLQELLAGAVDLVEEGAVLVRREYFTAIGPVDMLLSAVSGGHIAVELKRVGDIAGVEQLSRYLELLNRDSLLAPVRGVFAAQRIAPQAATLAADRGIACLVLDYDELRGLDSGEDRLF
jgi:RecB family endonuclease NucS